MKDFCQDCVENAQSMTPVGAVILRKHLMPNAEDSAQPGQALFLNIPESDMEKNLLLGPALRCAAADKASNRLLLIIDNLIDLPQRESSNMHLSPESDLEYGLLLGPTLPCVGLVSKQAKNENKFQTDSITIIECKNEEEMWKKLDQEANLSDAMKQMLLKQTLARFAVSNPPVGDECNFFHEISVNERTQEEEEEEEEEEEDAMERWITTLEEKDMHALKTLQDDSDLWYSIEEILLVSPLKTIYT
jgi:hypothetical protein